MIRIYSHFLRLDHLKSCIEKDIYKKRHSLDMEVKITYKSLIQLFKKEY